VCACLLIIASSSLYANLLGGEEPLAPEQAYKPKILATDATLITLSFSIEDGYYLYRDKLAFSVPSLSVSPQSESSLAEGTDLPAKNAVQLHEPEYPEALVIDDEYMGVQAIFRNEPIIRIPYTALPEVESFTLNIKYQGCADIGLCYPPTHVKLPIKLPESAGTANQENVNEGSLVAQLQRSSTGNAAATLPQSSTLPSASAQSTGSISGLLAPDDEKTLLPPELAYLPQIVEANSQQIQVSWTIEDGYYLYRDKTSFSLKQGDEVTPLNGGISQGAEQYDEFFGNVWVLRDNADAQLSLANRTVALGADTQLLINYQGCADIGVCFPPSVAALPIDFNSYAGAVSQVASSATGTQVALASNGNSGGNINVSYATVAETSPLSSPFNNTGSALDTQASPPPASGIPAKSEQDRITGLLSTHGLWFNIITFFSLGLMLAFTPCVLPMVPILSSMIVGQGNSMSTAKAFQLSVVYVLVMASTYAVVGVIVGLSGYNVQAFLQNPWVLSAIAGLFVLLSLSMFGFYQLQMPSGIQSRLTQWSNKKGGGQFSGAAAMGFVSTLIVGPCVTAPLAGALIYIAKTGDAMFGGMALFSLGMGMGAPLLLIGTSAGKFLPRAGAWMNATQHVFGILLLGMAIYMLSRFIPTQITMALSGVLALMSGVYLGATDSTTRESKGWHHFGKGLGLVASLYGVALLLGALSGSTSYITPLQGIAGTNSAQSTEGGAASHSLPFQMVKSVDDLQRAVNSASAQNKPVMLDFYADWCISCKEMDTFTFSDKRVKALLENAIVLQADVTANDVLDQALLKEFDLFGPPGVIFYSNTGQELRAARVVGFMNADNFVQHVQQFLGNSSNRLTMR